MTPTEKAKKIAKEYSRPYGFGLNYDSSIECYQSAMQMYEWCSKTMMKEWRKEFIKLCKSHYENWFAEQKQQMIDKVEDYLANNICNAYNFRGDDISSTFLDDLIKTMEEQL